MVLHQAKVLHVSQIQPNVWQDNISVTELSQELVLFAFQIHQIALLDILAMVSLQVKELNASQQLVTAMVTISVTDLERNVLSTLLNV